MLSIRREGGERQDEKGSKVTENLGMTVYEIHETISCLGKDGFALGGLQIEKLVEYLGRYMRSGIEQVLNAWILELDILCSVIDITSLRK